MTLFTDYHMHPQGHKHQPYTLELLQPWADSCRGKGITDFAVTDHDRYYPGIDFEAIARCREKNPDLNIRAGIELDNDPVSSEAGRAWVDKHWDQLDFVLGSVHYLGGESQMFDAADQAPQFDRLGVEASYENYLHQLQLLIGRGHIDCLAHLDLIKIHKYRLPNQNPADVFDPILRLIKQHDLAMEISTAGWRKPVGEQYPDLAIAQRAISLGIPFTIASDAHSHVQVGENYHRVAIIVQELGIKEVATFDKHQRTMKRLS